MEIKTIGNKKLEPIDNRKAHPSIWLDETAHYMIADMEEALEFITKGDFNAAVCIINSNKHYWSGVRDGNRFMRNPFKEEGGE